MPDPAFTLSVPTADPYRGLVTEAVRTYLRVSGRDTSSSADAFIGRLASVIDALSDKGQDIGVVVRAERPTVEVQVNCGDAARTLTHTLTDGA